MSDAWDTWLPGIDAICYGGDYNAEQWPESVWQEDVALMKQAGVNLVSVGVFSWAMIEPAPGEYDFAWLDRLLDLLDAHGIRVALGTPTAAPPAWFYARHPDSRVVTAGGVVLGAGSRGMPAPTSPDYRAAAVTIATALARRYGEHPALALWHIHNEYGVPVGHDYSTHALVAFRAWLQQRYQTLTALNDAWGTLFWGQYYHQWEEIGLPAAAATEVNPSQQLDFSRFSDEMLRECFRAERDAVRVHSSAPVTTNFMAASHPGTDLWRWAREVDIVSNDNYLAAADPRNHVGLAMAADLTRSVAGGRPWMLLEHSSSAVNWQPRNVAKRPGEEARNAFSHLGRGADAIMFFQWRASRFGAEKFHSAMLPHAGTDSRVWREVVELGGELGRLAPLRGSRVRAEAAILWDYESFWAQDLAYRPSVDADHRERVDTFYDRLWRDGITTDFAQPGQDLSGYRLVIAPASYLLTEADAANLTRFVESGGTLLVSFFSGIVDEHDTIHAGGFMAPLREALGVWVEEFLPLREGETLQLERLGVAGRVWADHLRVENAEIVDRYVDGPIPGGAAITRNRFGAGQGWYLSTSLDVDALPSLLAGVYADAGLHPSEVPAEVEVIARHGEDAQYLVAINHSGQDVSLALPVTHDLLADTAVSGAVVVPAGGVRVLRG